MLAPTMIGAGAIETLDLALRGASMALFVVIAAAVLRQGRARPVVWLGALLSMGAAAYAFCSAPGHIGHGSPWFAPVLAVCAGNVAVFWLFTRAAFDDSFRPKPWHALIWLALVICPVAGLFGASFATIRPIEIALRLAPMALALLALAQTVKDWRGDLVEGRRTLRLFIVVVVALHATLSGVVDLWIGPAQVPPSLHLVNALALASIAGVIAVSLLHADLDAVLAAPVLASMPPAAAAPAEEPVDPALLAELERLMKVERLYRQEGLTIGTLAARLGLSEHRLRRTINRGLGYRNFNEYLNRHRLADAKQALADPTQAAVPILTIALDAGFQSLGPFNRAFKAETGMTPSEFRRATNSRADA
jgi:AraC-like DNA-binding protein